MTSRTLTYLIFLLVGAAIGAVARGAIGSADQSPPAPIASAVQFERPSAGDDEAVIRMLESLSLALSEETEYRQTLENQIIRLEERLDALQSKVSGPGEAGRVTDQGLAEVVSKRAMRRRGPVTVQRLVEAGLGERDATAIQGRVDDLAMQRLYLRDQAMREGWLGSERYRDESRRLTNEQTNLRNEFGDDAYDRYLFAAGRSNRVEIQNVIAQSPAYTAGLAVGDRVVSYNGQRTYSPSDLRRATQQGSAGEMTAVRVIRDGRPLDLYLPRGPLGVQMTGVSEKP